MTVSHDKAPYDVPTDLWCRIATELLIRDKASLAGVNKACAVAVRRSWGPADYFESAGNRDRPRRLQVAHGPVQQHDTRAWLSLTQQMKLCPANMGSFMPSSRWHGPPRPVARPTKALIALAQSHLFTNPEVEASLWPKYRDALHAASRPREAAVFERLIVQADALEAAVLAGNLGAVTQLIAEGTPLPSKEIFGAALTAHPYAVDGLVDAWLARDSLHALRHTFAIGSPGARAALLRSPAFAVDRVFFAMYEGATRSYSAEPLTELLARCSAGQIKMLSQGSGQTSVPFGLGVLRAIATGGGDVRGKLASLLRAWCAREGDATDLLDYVYNRGVHAEVVPILMNHGAQPNVVLQRLATQPDRVQAKDVSSVEKLLRLGARLTYEQFSAYIERYRDQALDFGRNHGVGKTLRTFERHHAIPLPHGGYVNTFTDPQHTRNRRSLAGFVRGTIREGNYNII